MMSCSEKGVIDVVKFYCKCGRKKKEKNTDRISRGTGLRFVECNLFCDNAVGSGVFFARCFSDTIFRDYFQQAGTIRHRETHPSS